MFIVKNKKIFIGISIALVVLSITAMFIFKINKRLGIDFTGGALAEVTYKDARPAQTDLDASLQALNFGPILLQPAGETDYIVKSRDLNETEHASLLKTLSNDGKNALTETSFNSIGPSIGQELKFKALLLIILISLGIILFIAFAFRKVSKPVSSWKYGIIVVLTLLHDVAIPVGIFTVLSHFYGVEVDALFVVAVLTILGLSVSDTIVIFDRIRENLRNQAMVNKINFSETVGKSLEQSYVRSICTSLTVILVLLSLFFFGPVSTRYFALMLTAGMFFGTYSSIFLASPLLVWVEEVQVKNKENKKSKK
jgi:preprotein translocase subunit SecF